MTDHEDHFGDFCDHTDLKHLILTSYLRAWVNVVLAQRHHEHALFIDAFAGRGRDSSGKAGSPLIGCDVAREYCELKGSATDGTPPLQIIAVEKHLPNYAALLTAAKKCIDDGFVTVLKGVLEDHVEAILHHGASGNPRLFFLDPFGVKGLRAADLRRILAVERAEVLLLFNDTGANRLHGAATKRLDESAPPSAVSLFDDMFLADESHEPARRAASATTAAKSEDILRTAFGSDAYERAARAVASIRSGNRRHEWIVQYVKTIYGLGARYVVPFSVCDRDGNHKYYLVHASTHRAAIFKMKEAINTAIIRHGTDDRQSTLFYQTTVDLARTIIAVSKQFAGRTVRWVNGSESDTVKMFLIEETNALMSDMKAIQAELQLRGWLSAKRPETYSFPPRT